MKMASTRELEQGKYMVFRDDVAASTCKHVNILNVALEWWDEDIKTDQMNKKCNTKMTDVTLFTCALYFTICVLMKCFLNMTMMWKMYCEKMLKSFMRKTMQKEKETLPLIQITLAISANSFEI